MCKENQNIPLFVLCSIREWLIQKRALIDACYTSLSRMIKMCGIKENNYIKIASYKVNGLRNPVKSSTILTKLKTVVVVLISSKINHLAEMGDT